MDTLRRRIVTKIGKTEEIFPAAVSAVLYGSTAGCIAECKFIGLVAACNLEVEKNSNINAISDFVVRPLVA